MTPTTAAPSAPRPLAPHRLYKAVATNLGANIVRRELKLPEVEIPTADARWTFAGWRQ